MRSLQNNKKIIIKPNQITEAFKLTCIDKTYLNLERFNDALNYLFKPPIKMIHHTYLSKKLFEIIDEKKNGKIFEYEFSQALHNILKDKNYRFILSMQIMMKIPDKFKKFLEIDDILNYFVNSYVEGFKALQKLIILNGKELARKNLPIPTKNQIENWAKSYEKKIREEIYKDIKLIDKNITNKMELQQFIKWISNDHSIYLNYDFIVLPIATSLIELDNIEYNCIINLNDSKIKKSNTEIIKNKKLENEKVETKKKIQDDFGFVIMEKDEFQ